MSERAPSVPIRQGEQGLLSLSFAAASASPIPVVREPSQDSTFAPGSFKGSSSLTNGAKTHPLHKHRRLSATGQARRRLSDAREAASRPSAVTIQTAAATLSSLATLSLSGTPPPPALSFVNVSGLMQSTPSKPIPIARNDSSAEMRDDSLDNPEGPGNGQCKTEINGAGISVTSSKGGNGKKRGTIFKCESCSKVYRHPSCLIKHRWEHSPHWREASKFLLSKHQQVQLLEAAAILSHLSPSAGGGTSLPEDRSLWPSYLSGGLLPPPSTVARPSDRTPSSATPSAAISHPTSSSVPARSTSSSARSFSAGGGPRMHDYAIPGASVTHIRPGLLGVPTASDDSATPLTSSAPPEHVLMRSTPVPVPSVVDSREGEGGYSFVSAVSLSDAWSSPVSLGFAPTSLRSSSLSARESSCAGGWSLPRSSLRSSSRSRSRSASLSEGEFVEVDGGEEAQYGFAARTRVGGEKIEEEWDGMEMEMEM
ncbi:hypothetical protein B0H21DRAFT_706027 [Amylocystis lapponica]|nr:hypothetical protein B0H21DRAFT_706027 [Amylocystis lapponica]